LIRNMDDIARQMGVSKSTVSRALADSNQISAEVKARIQKFAAENGYVNRAYGVTKTDSASDTITVVLPTGPGRRGRISEPFIMEMVGGIADELLDRNINMLLTKQQLNQRDSIENLLATKPSKGYIILGQRRFHKDLCDITDAIPNMIVWGAKFNRSPYCTIGSNNFDGGKMATEHLLRLGRRKIAYFGGLSNAEPLQRYEGYRQALEDFGLPVDENLVIETCYDSVSAYSEITSWLRYGQDFDAVVTSNDVVAMSAIAALRDHNLNVPGQVSVVGFDDIPAAEYYHPPITTIRQNIAEGCSMLVEKLLLLSEGQKVRSATIPCELIIRTSCGSTQLGEN